MILKKNDFEIQYKTMVKTALITIVVMAILLYAPSPFVVIKPGLAVSSHSFVTVIDGSNDPNSSPIDSSSELEQQKRGTFLLTAVLMQTPNIWDSLLSVFQVNRTVMWKYEVLGGESAGEYAKRAMTMMQGSYDQALEAAYRYLNIAYHNEPQQLYVNTTSPLLESNSSELLLSGDRIDGIFSDEGILPVKSVEDIAVWLNEHEEAASIELQIERMSKLLRIVITLDNNGHNWDDVIIAKQLAIDGFMQMRNIVPDEDKYKIEFDSSSIGGPSAGLVLTLTIVDQLTDGDLTKGRTIAVTGTIDAEGHVGAIGGIKQKVFSTDEQGAEIFIVPQGNEDEASEKVRKLRSEMEIIAVSTLEEAMDVIASLER